jgi:phosphopantetheinyl transferase
MRPGRGPNDLLVLVAPRRRPTAADARGALSDSEWSVCRRLSHPRRRIDWLEGRLLAKSAFQLWLAEAGFELADRRRCSIVAVTAGAREGQPEILLDGAAWPGLHISISHWPEAVGVALASAPVGFDGEAIEPRPSLAHDAFTPGELELARELGRRRGWDEACSLTAMWTLKEAYLKLRGSGLRAALLRCRIEEVGDDAAAVDDAERGERRRLSLRMLCGAGWVAACLVGNRAPVPRKQWSRP